MKPKEAIEYLNNPIGKSIEGHIEAVEMATHALQKQTAKKPEHVYSIQFFGPTKTSVGRCAVCGFYVNSCDNFCSKCGNAIDWTEDEE